MQSFLNESRKLAFQYNKTVAEKIQNICSPVLESLGIKNLNYMKWFPDGRSTLHLSTNPEWNKYFFMQINANGALFKKEVNRTPKEGFYYYLWPVARYKEDHILSALYDFNMWHGLTIYRREKNILESWTFSTLKENELIAGFYINNKYVLERFIFYFKEILDDVINSYPQENLLVFKEKHNYEFTENPFPKQKIDRFIEQIPLQKYPIKGKTGQIYLSKRESECLFQLSLGKTAKEIARLLNLSPRTVEFYINNIKEKTDCRTSTELVRAFNEYVINRE